MRVLVTGAWGFVGSAFCRQIVHETDWTVIPFGRLSDKRYLQRLPKQLENQIVTGDICDPLALSGICEDVDYVIHFAAKTFVDHSIRDPLPFIMSNVVGTYNLLEQVRKHKVKRYIQISTDEVYGSILDGAYKEDAPLNPTNPYAAAKAGADLLALSYYRTYGIPVIVTRTENNYGPYQHRQKVLPVFTRRATDGMSLPVYGDGGHVRQWIHVDDHCRAIRLLLEKGNNGEIYHVAGNKELTNLELAKLVIEQISHPLDWKQYVEYIDDYNVRPGHDRRYALDSTKLRSLGWEPQIPLEEGIREAVGWYYRHPEWTQ